MASRRWARKIVPLLTLTSAAVVGLTTAPIAQQGQRPDAAMDPDRARALYVSNKPEDHARGYDFKGDVDRKATTDSRYKQASAGVMDFQKVTYRSSVGDMEIPAYLFQPLKKRGAK